MPSGKIAGTRIRGKAMRPAARLTLSALLLAMLAATAAGRSLWRSRSVADGEPVSACRNAAVLCAAAGGLAQSMIDGVMVRLDEEIELSKTKKHTLKVMPKTVIMAFEKGTGATVNEYLAAQGKGYLAKHKAAFVADISLMPKFITESFALPKMRKYPHTVLLIQDEMVGLKFPGEEEKITVMKFRGNFLTQIRYVTTAAELKAAIEE